MLIGLPKNCELFLHEEFLIKYVEIKQIASNFPGKCRQYVKVVFHTQFNYARDPQTYFLIYDPDEGCGLSIQQGGRMVQKRLRMPALIHRSLS